MYVYSERMTPQMPQLRKSLPFGPQKVSSCPVKDRLLPCKSLPFAMALTVSKIRPTVIRDGKNGAKVIKLGKTVICLHTL